MFASCRERLKFIWTELITTSRPSLSVSLCRKLCHIKLKLNHQYSSLQSARITDFYVMEFTKMSTCKNNVNIDQQIFCIWTTECSLKFYHLSTDVHSKRLPHLSLPIRRSGRRWAVYTCHCDPVLLLRLGSTQRPSVYWPFLLPLDFVMVQLEFFFVQVEQINTSFFLHSGA